MNAPPDQFDRQREYARRRAAEIAEAQRVASQRAILERRVQLAAFLTGDPEPWVRHAPAGWTVYLCADPNPAYSKHVTATNVKLLRDAGLEVGSWCGRLEREFSGFDGPGARFARGVYEDFGLDVWAGQFESAVEWDDCMEWGADVGIGNPWELTDEQRTELRDLWAEGLFAYTQECYWQIPTWGSTPKTAASPIGAPCASLTLPAGRFDGGGPIPLRDQEGENWPSLWRVSSLYVVEMTGDDFAVLPRRP